MNTADILFHVHPELTQEARAKVELEVMRCGGVISAHFDHSAHPHALVVLYNPDAVRSEKLLLVVRRHEPVASMAGL